MAWTAPRTWVVGEIVTATMMNTHVRDNLTYLKGQAGTVAIEDAMTVAGGMAATGAVSGASGAFSGSGGTLLSVTGTATSPTVSIVSPNVASQNAILSFTNTAQRNALIYMDRAADKLKISQNGTANPAITIDSGGSVGIQAATTPQGILHCYGTIAGAMFYEGDNLGASTTIIPNAAGDVIYGLVGQYATRESTGGIAGGNISLRTVGGASLAISADAALNISVAANGSVVLTRSVGTATYDVSLWLLWL